jgi:hypothetical protein
MPDDGDKLWPRRYDRQDDGEHFRDHYKKRERWADILEQIGEDRAQDRIDEIVREHIWAERQLPKRQMITRPVK